jgi:diguanylate cyclase (GGDEF)-like protein
MELLLWRWSTTAQITSALMIAVFFVVLGRSVRRVELRPWVRAWLVNLGALGVTSIFWLAQPRSAAAFIALRGAYFFTKTMFVVLLALGAWTFVRQRPAGRVLRVMTAGVALYAIAAALMVGSIDGIGVVQSGVMGLFLAGSAALLVVRRVPGSGWLAFGFALRAALAAIETIAYAAAARSSAVAIFLASHSSFDTGAEWVIALGCVLTLYRTIQLELTRSNGELVEAKERLQELVDRDSLTGLSNRRALPGLLRGVYDSGATILFFDLNDFKEINDSYGHHAGDACLTRFAGVLQSSFRPEDHVVRYAGDEFVVIAPAAAPEQLHGRVEGMRERLKFDRGDGPPIRFSAGVAYLGPGGDGESALRAADEAMYRDKRATKPHRARTR